MSRAYETDLTNEPWLEMADHVCHACEDDCVGGLRYRLWVERVLQVKVSIFYPWVASSCGPPYPKAILLRLRHSYLQPYSLSILNEWLSHPRNWYALPYSPWAPTHLLLLDIVPLHLIHPPSPFLRLPHYFEQIFYWTINPWISGLSSRNFSKYLQISSPESSCRRSSELSLVVQFLGAFFLCHHFCESIE